MADIATYKIQFKSDFVLTIHGDAGWTTPFCIKFWTSAPSQAYFAGWDGKEYINCKVDDTDASKLIVLFDDHQLPVGQLKMQMAWHTAIADFPHARFDEVMNQMDVVAIVEGEENHVELAFEGEADPEVEYFLPAYANEAQRIANEEERIAAEEQRIANEEARIAAETVRQQNEARRISQEQQRINHEQQRVNAEAARVSEFASLKTASEAATAAANSAATLANEKAQLAADKAALAQAAATLANEKAQLAADKAALAQQKADYAQTQGNYAKAQGDYAKAQGDYAKAQGDAAKTEAEAAHSLNEEVSRDEATRQQQETARQQAEAQRVIDFNNQMQQQQAAFQQAEAAMETAYEQAEAGRNTSFQQAEAARSTAFNNQLEQQQTAYTDAEAARETAFGEAETERDAKVDEKVADITNLQTKVADLENVVADLETIAEGYVRVAGSSSPALSYKSYKYHEQGGFGRESAFSLFYPCLIGTKLTGGDEQVGRILHILQKLDYGHDIYGNARKIDGSEGDVMITNIEPYYRIVGKHTIEGTEYDVFLMSRSPFTWQGIEAEYVGRFGWSPDYAVSHTDEDDVVRMHSVYNPDWAGSYDQPLGVGKFIFSKDAETGDIVETYDADATLLGGSGGLQTTNLALYTGEQYAMNHNPDTTKCVPFMNQTAAGAENLQCLLLAEGGTFDAHNATLMGSGFSSNDPATAEADWAESASGAKNGLRVVNKDGNWKYHGMSGNIRYLVGAASGTTYAYSFVNNARNPWHIMEAHRAMCYAIQNGVHELEWFVFEGNKYKWRSIDGFAGPAQGEMTCVVWKLMASKAAANAYDPSDSSVSIAGNRVEVLFSTALLHGMLMQVSPAWNTSGMVMTEDENGRYECYMERDQESLIKTENGSIDISEHFEFEKRYKHVLTVDNGNGYAKNYSNDALMLPNTNANKSGGGLHTYVGKYNYFSGDAAAAGKKLVRAWRRGRSASNAGLSPLYVFASYALSFTNAASAFGTCCQIVD